MAVTSQIIQITSYRQARHYHEASLGMLEVYFDEMIKHLLLVQPAKSLRSGCSLHLNIDVDQAQSPERFLLVTCYIDIFDSLKLYLTGWNIRIEIKSAQDGIQELKTDASDVTGPFIA